VHVEIYDGSPVEVSKLIVKAIICVKNAFKNEHLKRKKGRMQTI